VIEAIVRSTMLSPEANYIIKSLYQSSNGTTSRVDFANLKTQFEEKFGEQFLMFMINFNKQTQGQYVSLWEHNDDQTLALIQSGISYYYERLAPRSEEDRAKETDPATWLIGQKAATFQIINLMISLAALVVALIALIRK
jgi:hypothetical protein